MKPVKTIRERNISIAIWDNGKFLNYTISKGYKDALGNWHNQKILIADNELDTLVRLIEEIKKLKIEVVPNDDKEN